MEYGNTIVISHGGGLTTLYAHQSSILVQAGDRVDAGQTIGFVGSSGRTTGPHLHFETRINGAPCNPLGLIEGEQGEAMRI
jgi:murein DD-endopeptidase MepM/ murein hydrolase activator NlpD